MTRPERTKRHACLSGRNGGATLIEVLVGITLLATLVLVVGASLLPSMRLTADSSTAASSATTARDLLENIEAQWSMPAFSRALTSAELAQRRDHFDRTCVKTDADFPGVPQNVSVTVMSIQPAVTADTEDSVSSAVLEQVPSSSTCISTPDDPVVPLKRVTVSVTGPNGKVTSRLTLDIRRP